ncbi:MAG TPA: amino acid decarboxylase [Candidatus Pygmaiobacter gallistercoris]|nr:amino acid decarboxylase [Candidatus Pygmaiobacter gallistercoris]
MKTPVYDFARTYAARGGVRLHMPGHKGTGPLGCEALDLTEIAGADSLYEADGILAESERNAAGLFGTGQTFFSAGGSSQCVKAMLLLAVRRAGRRGILAARNVHKSFVQAAALLDLEPRWLWPQGPGELLRCDVSEEQLDRALADCDELPAAVYLTSPDYLGHLQPVDRLAAVCHRYGVPLLVDNAHGAYLHFLSQPCHPIDLGADLCCDSAHKTLPVLTGGAYLHLAKGADFGSEEEIRQALSLFGSTSPSYLILESLDLCNRYLDEIFPAALEKTVGRVAALKKKLTAQGWSVLPGEPFKITLCTADCGFSGRAIAQQLRQADIECEYADPDYLVLMVSPQNPPRDLERLADALPPCPGPIGPGAKTFQPDPPRQAVPVRQALFARCETVPASESVGRICAAPTVSCPPAVPVAVSGEVITAGAAAVFAHYGIETVSVLCP